MADITERLRWSGQDAVTKHLSLGMHALHSEAADEIDQLRRCLLQSRCPVDGRGFVDACIEDGSCGCTNGLKIPKELLTTPALRKS